MSEHKAKVGWRRDGVDFVDHKYSRAHRWEFDGGATVEASASPSVVPEPYSVPEAVDPEEALVASASSCHMLWFLALAARRGFTVDSYIDEASGIIEKDHAGRQAFSRITLNPQVKFSGSQPSDTDLAALHEEAHNSCFIANSLRCAVIVSAACQRDEADRPKAS